MPSSDHKMIVHAATCGLLLLMLSADLSAQDPESKAAGKSSEPKATAAKIASDGKENPS